MDDPEVFDGSEGYDSLQSINDGTMVSVEQEAEETTLGIQFPEDFLRIVLVGRCEDQQLELFLQALQQLLNMWSNREVLLEVIKGLLSW